MEARRVGVVVGDIPPRRGLSHECAPASTEAPPDSLHTWRRTHTDIRMAHDSSGRGGGHVLYLRLIAMFWEMLCVGR